MPPLREQRKIAAHSFAYDNLIENNAGRMGPLPKLNPTRVELAERFQKLFRDDNVSSINF